jgi:hypothetical protein
MAETPVTSRDGLIRVIFELLDDYDSEGDKWENKDIYTFLQAMAAWLNDAAGYYRNTGQNVAVEQPSWQLFADALTAASVYE